MPARKAANKPVKILAENVAKKVASATSVSAPQQEGRILFSKTNATYGCFSNFSPHPVLMPFPSEVLNSEAAKSSPAASSAVLISGDSKASPSVLIKFPTSEHYFQCMKFPAGSKAFFACVDAPTPAATKKAGGNRSVPIREDWNTFRHKVMLDVLTEKFGNNNPELRDKLLGTGSAELVEHAAWDRYWGDGGNGKGQNHLGKTLMQIRAALVKGATGSAVGVPIDPSQEPKRKPAVTDEVADGTS